MWDQTIVGYKGDNKNAINMHLINQKYPGCKKGAKPIRSSSLSGYEI